MESTTSVERICQRGTHVPVYNIEVEGDHVYRVGQSGVLVHNTSCHICDNLDETNVLISLTGKGGTYQARINRGERKKGSEKKLYCRVKSIHGKIKRFKSDQDSSESRKERKWIQDNFWSHLPTAYKYAAGHLIADKLGGPNNRQQMVSMYKDFNKGKKLWEGMENFIYGCLAGEKRKGVTNPNPDPDAFEEGYMIVTVDYDDNASGAEKAFPTKIKVQVTFFKGGLSSNSSASDKTHTFTFTQANGSGTRNPSELPDACV